jgi:glycosyltransferase involved in cell wall biosynthesis
LCGDASWLVDPNNEQAWADAMRELLGDAAKRNELRRRGLARAAQFTWQRTAGQTFTVYHKVAVS